MEKKTQENMQTSPSGNQYYSDSSGTGVVSSIVFVIIAIVIMAVAAHFLN